MSADTGGGRERQVSYFGPIYIRNSHLVLPDQNGYRDDSVGTDKPNPGLSLEDQIDVSRYRIKTPTSTKKHQAPSPPTSYGLTGVTNMTSSNMCERSTTTFKPKTSQKMSIVYKTSTPNLEPYTCNDKSMVTNTDRQSGNTFSGNGTEKKSVEVEYATVTKIRRQRYMKGRRPGSCDMDDRRNANLFKTPTEVDNNNEFVYNQSEVESKEYEVPVSAAQVDANQVDVDTGHYEEYTVRDSCPFKISSTEDNYMLDRFRNKTDRSQQTNDMSNEPEVVIEIQRKSPQMKNSHRTIGHQRSKSAPEEESSLKMETKSSSSSARDFLAKHRKRIAKLKRRFFENQSITKPLPFQKEAGDTDSQELSTENKLDNHNLGHSTKSEFTDTSDTSQTSADTDTMQTPSKIQLSGNNRRHSADGLLGRSDFEAGLRRRWSTSGRDFAVVIAIDFGTTYSGYAYSFVHEPDTIHLMRRQESGEPGVFDQKIPTTILLNPDGLFHSFGYAAREYYYDLEPKEAAQWMYFDRFKMMLHDEKTLKPDTVLRTHTGKEVSALKVFAYSLAYFKDLALQEISDQSALRITTDVIRWIITVPAIWKASAKQFMRQAAYETETAGLEKSLGSVFSCTFQVNQKLEVYLIEMYEADRRPPITLYNRLVTKLFKEIIKLRKIFVTMPSYHFSIRQNRLRPLT